MSTYMPAPGQMVAGANGAGTSEIGFGITFLVNGKPITLDMPNINEIAKGNFQFAMAEGEKVGFDKLSEFYTGLQTSFTFLPTIDWTTLPEPVKTMAGFGLWISNFSINIEDKALKQFTINVLVDFHDWQVPGIPSLKISGTSLSVAYDASGQATLLSAQPYGNYELPAAAPGYAVAVPAG
jgi:hypothetical protein